MALFQTIVHPTDFDAPSLQAFRLTRGLAQAFGARVVVFHVVPPPAVLTEDGRVILDPKKGKPVDLWERYRPLQADAPGVQFQYAVVVGTKGQAMQLLEAKVRELGDGVLVVMGSHGRTGLRRLVWGSKAEAVVRQMPCPVLVAKAPAPPADPFVAMAEINAEGLLAGDVLLKPTPRDSTAEAPAAGS